MQRKYYYIRGNETNGLNYFKTLWAGNFYDKKNNAMYWINKDNYIVHVKWRCILWLNPWAYKELSPKFSFLFYTESWMEVRLIGI